MLLITLPLLLSPIRVILTQQ